MSSKSIYNGTLLYFYPNEKALITYAAFQELFDAVDRSLLPSKLNAKQRVKISLDGPSSSIFCMDITKSNDHKPFHDVLKYCVPVKHSNFLFSNLISFCFVCSNLSVSGFRNKDGEKPITLLETVQRNSYKSFFFAFL